VTALSQEIKNRKKWEKMKGVVEERRDQYYIPYFKGAASSYVNPSYKLCSDSYEALYGGIQMPSASKPLELNDEDPLA